MAKKKAPADGPKKTRKVPYTSAALRAEADAIGAMVKRLGEIADAVDRSDDKSIMVEGRAMLERAKKFIKHFCLNAERGVN